MAEMREVLDRALALSAIGDDSFLDLAACLARLQNEAPNDWKRFLAKGGMGRRKAYYLASIGQQFSSLKLAPRRLKRIGWTKLQIIARHIDRANASQLLKLAEENTAARLQRLMAGRKPPRKTRCVLMYFAPEQYRQFEKAVLLNGGERSGRGLRGKEIATVKMIEQAVRATGNAHAAGRRRRQAR